MFKIFLFFWLNLSYSFFINKKYNTQISNNYKYKLNMGCDYYIDKNLHIYDNSDKLLTFINLERERGYYWFCSLLDEDEEGYDKELTEYIKNILEPSMKPIIIYSNNTFNKINFETKYKKIIQNKLNLFNKTLNDVNKIIKIENRYER